MGFHGLLFRLSFQHHRVIVHSLLRQNWGDRLRAAPAGEREAIIAKRDVQNRVGRETLRREEQTS
ncbi:hypothetical protein RB213_006287 [Colletotrichum asianum]